MIEPGVSITPLPPEEAAAFQAKWAAEQSARHNATIDAAIAGLETKQARPLREAELARAAGDPEALAAAQARIQAIEDQIAELRAQRVG